MVRNRYLRIERGKWLTEQGKSKNRCGQCGELKRGHRCKVLRTNLSNHTSAMLAQCVEIRDYDAPDTPNSQRTTTTLNLGAPPLTMAFPGHGEGQDGPHSVMSSPGPLSCGLSLGLSPLGVTTPGGGLSGIPGLSEGRGAQPPSLRAQNSMDILLQASDLHRIRSSTPGATPGATPLASEFEHNPFKLPSVSASQIPIELQTEGRAPSAAAEPLKGCAEEAAQEQNAAPGGEPHVMIETPQSSPLSVSA
jgi:hypothetical protein